MCVRACVCACDVCVMHTLTFTASVQTAFLPVSEVCIRIVPHEGKQRGMVEEADALHPVGRNEDVNTQLGNIANGYTGLKMVRYGES